MDPQPDSEAVAPGSDAVEDESAAALRSRLLRNGSATPKLIAIVVLMVTAAAILVVMQPQLILRANTPTGGDMGAHVYVPAYLRDTLIPSGRLIGWSNDWYAGFPILYFYFPLPALTIVLLDVVLPYGVAFKMVTVAGLVGLPFAVYFLVRSLGFSRPIATIASVSGATFIFMESHTIFGGNIAATLAGEYSFSWSLSLSLVYLGLVIKASREERGFTPAAAVVLALTALSHLITTMVVVVVSLPLLLRRRGVRPVLGAWAVGFLITGFWSVPLLARVAGFTADMGWNPVEGWAKVLPREMLPMALLGAIGLVWSLLRRYDVVPMLWMAIVPVGAYFVIDYYEFTKLYNARLLPFWYLTMHIFAGVAAGLAAVEVARRVGRRRTALSVGTVLASMFFLVVGLVGLSFAPGWAEWNYRGYEGKDSFSEYEGLIETLDGLPPGRVMWEANSDLNKYGTPMALMLLPYWTEGDFPSMEGLLFESAITTPFHFLNASEVSNKPSNPVRGLDYHTFEFERSLDHLPLYNVDYYVAFTDEAKARARDSLESIAVTEPFEIFQLPDSRLVDVATSVPVVLEGGDFQEAALTWYDNVGQLDRWMVQDGPEDWPRIESPEEAFLGSPTPVAGGGVVSEVVLEDHRVSFRTTAVGVPHLVKVSYFPNWEATGAEGPYRAAPSLMVVIPTEESVELNFAYTWAEQLGWLFTVAGIATVVTVVWRRRREQAPAEVPPRS